MLTLEDCKSRKDYRALPRTMAAIGLYQPKNGLNVGSVLRACDAFGADALVIQGRRHRIGCTDTSKAFRRVPTMQVEDIMQATPAGCVPVGVEMTDDACALPDFSHPAQAFYIFGPEDGYLPAHIGAQRVSIPSRICLNLAAAVNVVLYDRAAKTVEVCHD